MVKKGNFNKAPGGYFFQIYRYWYTDSLFKIKFNMVSEHLKDDSDELACTVPKSIIMRPSFGSLSVIIGLEGGVIFYNIVCCVYKSITQHPRATLGHTFFLPESYRIDIRKGLARQRQAACLAKRNDGYLQFHQVSFRHW